MDEKKKLVKAVGMVALLPTAITSKINSFLYKKMKPKRYALSLINM